MAAAYLVFLALILIYVAIMAAKLARIEREIGELAELTEARDAEPEQRQAAGGAAMSELLALGDVAQDRAAGGARADRAARRRRREAARRAAVQAFIAEAVAVSTCNRTELYLVVSDPSRRSRSCSASWPAAPASA